MYIKAILDILPFSSLNLIINNEISTLADAVESLAHQLFVKLEETFKII